MKLKRWQWCLIPLLGVAISSFSLTSCSKSPTKDAEPGKSWLIQKKSNKNDWISFWKDCLPSFNGLETYNVITTSPLDNIWSYLETKVSTGAFASWIFCEISLNISQKCDGNKSYGIDCKDYSVDFDVSKSAAKFSNNQLDIKTGASPISLSDKPFDIKYNKKWQLSYTKATDNSFTDYFDLFALSNTGNFAS